MPLPSGDNNRLERDGECLFSLLASCGIRRGGRERKAEPQHVYQLRKGWQVPEDKVRIANSSLTLRYVRPTFGSGCDSRLDCLSSRHTIVQLHPRSKRTPQIPYLHYVCRPFGPAVLLLKCKRIQVKRSVRAS